MSDRIQFRAILQAVDGPLKGQLCQVIKPLEDGGVDCFCRAFDGTPTLFKIPASDIAHWRSTGGVALLGPKVEQVASSPLPQTSAPPPLNPEELLEPLPPEVKAQPMKADALRPPTPKSVKPPKSKPGPYTGPKVPCVFKVKNALGDEAEITLNVRADWSPERYNGPAIMMATKVIQPVKPYSVQWSRK